MCCNSFFAFVFNAWDVFHVENNEYRIYSCLFIFTVFIYLFMFVVFLALFRTNVSEELVRLFVLYMKVLFFYLFTLIFLIGVRLAMSVWQLETSNDRLKSIRASFRCKNRHLCRDASVLILENNQWHIFHILTSGYRSMS